ncbi:AraC family transcriptional regulator [Rhodocytophaga rosea]|uniref:AraC family transcriptional regulator n=1 Tax=Rhodocytophaga rosea TaxID=2704465 RepID=A0A6C0GFU9_9BACT|nr:AraC family transcriptional regulator [Rhodocytophaga rosea]QHT66560.1 AraC family transcriptional regulator [Rhodocytophaga rosea]
MKIKLEEIRPDTNRSFRLLLTPHLNDLFFWHYHPEYEIVYIEGASGTRHIGEHISAYENSDLVFIGPNIPHLNFDYGVKTDYQEVVVQLKEDFLGQNLHSVPEFSDIASLFEKARQGISFYGETKRIIGEKLNRLSGLQHFDQLIELLHILQLMAISTECLLLHHKPIAHYYNLKEQQRIQRVYRYIEENYQQKITVEEMAGITSLTTAAFCRYFKKMTRLTFTEFVNQYRINQAKKLLLQHKNVTEACFESGFESLSYFNKIFKRLTGENPVQFKKQFLK